MRDVHPEVQFYDLTQQGEVAQLGMWAFIATEILFFGGLIFTYYIYRGLYGDAFVRAGHDARILLGAINAVILITSSLTMVSAVNAAADGRRRAITRFLWATVLLGVMFLGVKGYEYAQDYADHLLPSINFIAKPDYAAPSQLFWIFYLIATGLHAIHLTIGIGVILFMIWRVGRGAFSPRYYAPLEVAGLYWSFVDTVWIFLFPALYLMGRSGT